MSIETNNRIRELEERLARLEEIVRHLADNQAIYQAPVNLDVKTERGTLSLKRKNG